MSTEMNPILFEPHVPADNEELRHRLQNLGLPEAFIDVLTSIDRNDLVPLKIKVHLPIYSNNIEKILIQTKRRTFTK